MLFCRKENRQTTHKPKASTCRKMLFPYVLALFPFPLFGNRTGIFVPREKKINSILTDWRRNQHKSNQQFSINILIPHLVRLHFTFIMLYCVDHFHVTYMSFLAKQQSKT